MKKINLDAIRGFKYRMEDKWDAVHPAKKAALVILILALAIGMYILIRGPLAAAFGRITALSGVSTDDVDIEATIEEYKTIDSDIDGMTVYDKYKMGLNTDDDSDTDMDGLPDKEEIEVYGSDPLKYSTADDLYSDKYKVDNGLDVKKKIDGGNDQPFPYNDCSNITLTAARAMDFNANVHDQTGYHETENANVYAEYSFDMFEGDITIDMTGMLPEGDPATNLAVYVSYLDDEYDVEKLDYSIDEKKITISNDWDSDHFNIVLADKSGDLVINNPFEINAYVGGYKSNKRLYFVEGCPLTSYIGAGSMTIWATDLDTPEATEAANAELQAQVNAASGTKFWDDYPKYEVKSASRLKIYSLYKGYETYLDFFRQDKENSFFRAIQTYYMTSNLSDIKLGEELIFNGTTITGDEEAAATVGDEFTIGYDNFAFENLRTEKSDGNCAGLSYLITEIYNSNGANAIIHGNYKDYSWDLNADPELQKLLSRGVSDFRDSDYFTANYGNRVDFSEVSGNIVDKNFINLVSAYQEISTHGNSPLIVSGSYPDYLMIDKMVALLDKGYTLALHVGGSDQLNHAVVIYDYEKVDNTRVVFKVYDCNFPDNTTSYVTKTIKGDFSIVTKKIKVNGKDKFVYEYNPFNGTYLSQSYRAYSLTDGNKNKFYRFNAYIASHGQNNLVR